MSVVDFLKDQWDAHAGADRILHHDPRIVTDEHISEAEGRAQFYNDQVHKRAALNDVRRQARIAQTKIYGLKQADRVHKVVAEQARRVITAEATGQIGKARKLGAAQSKERKRLDLANEYQQYLTGA